MVAYRFARTRFPSRVFLVSGIAVGSIIAPVSLGLYATFFIPYVGLVPGMVGLFLTLLHSAPGFQAARVLGLVSPAEIIAGTGDLYFAALNAVIWGIAYGSLGGVIDWLRSRRRE
jgi:hypothetical protein